MVKEEQMPLFKRVCDFALRGFPAREDASKAKDITGMIFINTYTNSDMRWIALYEGERRIVGNRDTPEVCWICIGENGHIKSIAARHIRKMKEVPDFRFWDNVSFDEIEINI